MTMRNIKLLWLTSLLFIVSCSNTVEEKEIKAKENVQKTLACPIIESGKWHSWLDKYQQQEGSYRLKLSGEVLLPNPAYKLKWLVGPTDRMNPPGLRLFLKPIALSEMAIQVITTVPVNYELETPISNYRFVSIYCEGKLLAKIENVILTD